MVNAQSENVFLLADIGGKSFYFSVAEVERVLALRADDISPVPFDKSGRILGLFSSNGALTVLMRWGTEALKSADGSLNAVILRDRGRRFAVPVDRAKEIVFTVPEGQAVFLGAHELYSGEADDSYK